MRRLAIIMIMVCILSPCAVFCAKMGFGVDFAPVQDIFTGEGSFQADLDFRLMLTDEFQIRVPVAVTADRTSFLIESGVALVYYPWHTGPFMGLSVFQFGFSQNCSNLENLVNLNEVSVGWSFEFGPGLFIEPCLVIRDPSGTFSDEYSRLKGTFPCYTTFRGRLIFGWYFRR